MRPLSVSILKGRKGLTFSQSTKIWRVIDLAKIMLPGIEATQLLAPSSPIGHLEFVRSEACQRKVTHDEDEDYPPHRPNGSDEVRAVLGVVHAF